MNYLRSPIVSAIVLAAAQAANAGLVLEKQPDILPPLPAQTASAAKAKVTDGAQKVGRNVDMSAKIAPMAKMNRQRIDLESKVTSRITQSGTAPAELQVLRGLGRQVTLEDALRQILPGGWEAYSDQDLPADKVVDWDGNRTWPMALHGVLAERDMRAHIDWDNQELMLFVPAVKQDTIMLAAAPGAVSVAGATMTEPVASPVAPPVASFKDAKPAEKTADKPMAKVQVKDVVWSLSTEKTLRENLRQWAAAAGWNLVWSATFGDTVVDYPVDAKVDFTGELVGVNGAMAKVIAAYSDADRPLEIEFFKGNRVIEVRLHRIPDMKTAVAPSVFVPADQTKTK